MITEQQQFDELNQDLKLASKEEFQALIQKKEAIQKGKNTKIQRESYCPFENAMRQNPGLTMEDAEAMARAFGY